MIFYKKTLSATIACLFGLSTFQANAALVTLNITGSTNTTAGAVNTFDNDASGNYMSAYSDVYEYPDTTYAHAKGDNTGWFYSNASGQGNFLSQSTVTQRYDVTNDNNNDQFFDFSFEVMNGSIDANCGDNGYGYGEPSLSAYGSGGCGSTDFSESGYSAQILLNGSSIWGSAATVVVDANGAAFTSSGTTFSNSYQGSNYLGWGKTLFNINLGLVAANASFVLEYVVTTRVEGFLLDSSNVYNSGYAQFGDPNGFSSTNNTFGSRSTDVPEPAVLALLGLGLAGLGFSRRKNKTSH